MANKKKKRKDADKILTLVIVLVISTVCIISYFHKQSMLQESGITTCIVVDRRKKPGTAFHGYLAKIEYCINNIKYTHEVPNSSDDYKIGDRYRLRYSIRDPKICEVLWEDKVNE